MPSDLPHAYPLTPLQQGLLYHALLDEDGGAYVLQVVLRIDGLADPAAMRRAWDRAVSRHPALRVSFYWAGLAEPLQVVDPQAQPLWHEDDWSDLAPPGQEDRLAGFLAADRAQGFRLEEAPLLRLALLRLQPSSFWLVFTHHHLILDGWSISLVFSEVTRDYAAQAEGRELGQPPPRPFGDYLAWLRSRDLAGTRRFWAAQLGDVDRPTPVPGLRRRPAPGSGDPQMIVTELGEQQSRRLAEFARAERLSSGTLGVAAWALTLAARARVADVLFDLTHAGRPAELPGAGAMVGMFINTVPARIQVDDAQPAADWLRAVQLRLAEAQRHGYLALGDAHAASQVRRDVTLSESLVLVQNYTEDWLSGPGPGGLRITQRLTPPSTSYPVVLLVSPGPRWMLRIAYDSSRCEPEVAEAMLDGVAGVLADMPASGQQPCSVLLARPAAGVAQMMLAGTFTVDPVRDVLGFWFAELGLAARAVAAAYGQLFPALLDPESELNTSGNGNGVLLVRLEDLAGPGADPGDPAARSRLADNVGALISALRAHRGHARVPTLICLCPPSPRWADPAAEELAAAVTDLTSACRSLPGVSLTSDTGLAQRYRTGEIHDPHGDAAGHLPYTDDYLAALGTHVLRAVLGNGPDPFEAYVFDADDTLWPGSCAEDQVSPEPGSPWFGLQELAAAQIRAGRTVGVATRNDARDVAAALRSGHPALAPDRLAGWRATWDDPAANLAALARAWDVPVGSCLYITGNPVSHAAVMMTFPQVTALLMPRSREAAGRFVSHLWALDLPSALADRPDSSGRAAGRSP
jgi:hypothetical protein